MASPDWHEPDLSAIDESRFPIHCEACGYLLTALGDAGRCPECFTHFRRRERLFEEHGPEAFVDRSGQIPEAVPPRQSFGGALSWTLLSLGTLLLAAGLVFAWYGRVDGLTVVVVSLILLSILDRLASS